MAIKRPDIYEHNNPLNAIVDSDFVRGGVRTSVANLNELYQIGSGINDKIDQLKEYATKIYVSGENKFYILENLNNRTNISGWIPESVGDLDLSSYATKIDLQNTGQNLNQKIDNLSGYSTGTFATINNLNLTGSTLQQNINIVSGNLGVTGQNLQSQIDDLSVKSIAYAIALG